MLRHGYIPNKMLISTIIPIPKNRRKSLNDSDNYRGIALSSILGKVLDWVILLSSGDALRTSDAQFGFKPKHSTSQCTFVAKETIQYYVKGGSSVYVMLLDASKAFDRIEYLKLFKILLTKGLCPLVCRLIYSLYLNQEMRIKWGGSLSQCFKVTNGVKQGAVLSPILFSVYIDVLITRLGGSKTGCYIGDTCMAVFSYADDLILLAPTKRSMYTLLDVCDKFASEYNVKFNPEKSKLIVYNDKQKSEDNFDFNGVTNE